MLRGNPCGVKSGLKSSALCQQWLLQGGRPREGHSVRRERRKEKDLHGAGTTCSEEMF